MSSYMETRKLGAIDIGSNGVRLLISHVFEQQGEKPIFSKNSLTRVPIRLGADVFANGEISAENIQRLTDTIQAYSLLMKVHKVEKFRACATSAMREAKNNQYIVERIAQQTGIHIEIIDGKQEASIIANSNLHNIINTTKNYIYIDVGGGSTEFTIYSQGKKTASQSFPIGSVRLLNDMVCSQTWKETERWIKQHTQSLNDIEAIGSGGNINKIFKDSGKKKETPLSMKFLQNYLQEISSYNYEERIRVLGFNPDRADVITHATKIYINAMKWAKAKQIIVPKIGLCDGIVRTLYKEMSS